MTERNLHQTMQQVGAQDQVSETKTSRSFARWVGFEEKTLWDWFQMLVVPVALAIGALYIDITASYIAADRQREESINDYFSEMTTLLLEHNLRQADKASEVRSVARVRTLTTLRKMDGARKGFIMLFLSESKLIYRDDPIVSLYGANLLRADLTGIDLSNTDLQNVYLHQAKFDHTELDGANLSNAVLTEAELKDTNLMDAHLCNTYFPDGAPNNRDCPE